MINQIVLSLVADIKAKIIMVVFVQMLSLVCHILIVFEVVKVIETKMIDYKLILLLCIKGVLVFLLAQIRNRLSNENKEYLRSQVFDKMEEGVLEKNEMIQLSGESIEHIDMYVSQYLPQFFYAMSAPIILFIVIAQMNLGVGIVLLVLVPMIPMSIVFVQRFAKKLLATHYGAYLNLGSRFIERVEGLSTLVLYDIDDLEQEVMEQEAESFRRSMMRVLLMQLNSISVMDFFAYGGAGIACILIVSAYHSGSVSLSQSLIMVFLAAEYFIPMRILGSFFHVSMNGVSAAELMRKYFDTQFDVQEGFALKELEVSNLDFNYGSKQVLQNVNFSIKQGKWLGIAGVSGCGKSTLMNILRGNLQSEVKGFSKEYLIHNTGFLSSDPVIFKGTLRNNLKMGKKIDDAYLYELLDDLNLGGFDLDYLIDPNASNLSGGQKQRIAFGRLLIKDPDLYFLDEFTSAVDFESESVMFRILEMLHKEGKSIVMISHRFANFKYCDEVTVLKDGSVSGVGTYETLLDTCMEFQRIVLSQMELEGDM